MGAWGTKTFENDDALDWVWDLETSEGTEFLRACLTPREVEGYDLDTADGAGILCAAEVVAALGGRPAGALLDEAVAWIRANRELDVANLVPLALEGIDRVLAEHSELRELWEENADQFPEWLAGVRELRERLVALTK